VPDAVDLMNVSAIQTKNLDLILRAPGEVRTEVEAMDPAIYAELSPEWLALLKASDAADPWVHGFVMIHRASGAVVGWCGFKGPPADGVSEIAYDVAPDHQGKGFATEAAEALTRFAFASGEVRIVRAHTLPEPNASTRVLSKCGFRSVGEVIDPHDGPVWRWERVDEVG
jgi:RimJ/RimL family protein N-acetyltransferase